MFFMPKVDEMHRVVLSLSTDGRLADEREKASQQLSLPCELKRLEPALS